MPAEASIEHMAPLRDLGVILMPGLPWVTLIVVLILVLLSAKKVRRVVSALIPLLALEAYLTLSLKGNQ
ncbi:hypothetical protein [Streptosporangium sp. V21-05]|uniref:hypothetical protein n=1 Tax=Streptosporangium sp. V21-05 TaxID=3446115 RepID=UPI003F52E51E